MSDTTRYFSNRVKFTLLSVVCLFSMPALSAHADAKNAPTKTGWTGQVSLSLSSSQGNTNLENLNIGALAKYKNESPLSHRFRASIAQAKSAPNRDADKRTTKDIKRYNYRADYALGDKNFAAAYIGYEEDAKVKLDSEVVAIVGIGRHSMGTKNHKFLASLGIGQVNVEYTDGTSKVSDFATRLGLGYNGKITDTFSFKTDLVVLHSDPRTMKRLTSSINYKITEKASIALEHEISHRNKIANTAVDKKDDVTKLNFIFKF